MYIKELNMTVIKFYLLRHSFRNPIDYSYNSELIPQGQRKACLEIKNSLLLLGNIRYIYSSVYPRVIQTVLPYVIETNRKITIDDCLHEWDSEYHPSISAKKDYGKYICAYKDYPRKSGVLETFEEVLNRVIYFLKQEYINLDNSLICSHQGILSAFIALSDSDLIDGQMDMGEVRTVNIDLDGINFSKALDRFRVLERQ